MVGIYERKRSAAALWCYRLALFAVPYFLLVILLHRTARVTTPQVYWLLGVGLFILLLSLVLAFKALSDLWNEGHKGGGFTIRGIVLVTVMLVPFGQLVYLALARPLVNDVSTSVIDPPQFVTVQTMRTAENPGINALSDYDDEYGERIVRAYPRLSSRRYPAGAERVYRAVRALVIERGWKISGQVNAPQQAVSEDEEQEETDENQPDQVAPEQAGLEQAGSEIGGEGDDIFIEAEVTSMIMAYKSDVVIRIITEDENTLVDMRSSSRWGRHDFGTNARTVIDFMNDLDQALLGIAGEG